MAHRDAHAPHDLTGRRAAVSSAVEAAPSQPIPMDLVWRPCPHCWGQRRIIEYVPALNGEGPVPHVAACETCLGIGEVLR